MAAAGAWSCRGHEKRGLVGPPRRQDDFMVTKDFLPGTEPVKRLDVR